MDHKNKNKKTIGRIGVSAPKQSTGYIMTPIEKRFQVLYSFMKRNATKKVMIFVNSCGAAQFFEEFMQLDGLPIMAIYGKQDPSERKNILHKFITSKSGILVCSEKIIKLSTFPLVDYMIQFDPPLNFKAYINRLRRTSTQGVAESILFITEEEMEVIRYLKTKNVDTQLIDIQWTKVKNIQSKLERWVKDRYAIYLGAKQAFAGYVKAYNEHPKKNIYSITNISLTKAAKNFGFDVPPFVDLTSSTQNQNGKRKREIEGSSSKEELKLKKVFKPVKKLKIGKQI